MKRSDFFAVLEAISFSAMLIIWLQTDHPIFLFLAGCAFGAGATLAALRFSK